MVAHHTPASNHPDSRHSCEGLPASGVAGIQNTCSNRPAHALETRIDKEDVDSVGLPALVLLHESSAPVLPV